MADADITLRHVARRHPEDLARAFVPEGHPVEVLGWIDTQVTMLERRLDKALRLRVDGAPRVLHVEFCFTLRDDVPDRIFEYLGFLFAALRSEAPADPVPPIESVLVVLSGRKRRLPATGERRISWPHRRFSGARFRVDAVYQRTIAELRARGSAFWLVFAPLARDATVPALRRVIADLHASAASDEERVELLVAFFAMASIDPWGHNLRKELIMMTKEDELKLLRRIPVVEELIAAAARDGEQKATLELLGRLFARRVGRRPTTEEERLILERAGAISAGEVEDALLDLDRDALLRWLAEPVRRS